MGRLPRKKEDIDSAAIRLFSSKGLARTSIKDIAKEAGVTEGALYRHYKSKDQMAWELYTGEIKKFTTGLSEIIKQNISAQEKLIESIKYLYSYYDKYPVEFGFILLTQHGFPGEKLLDENTNPNDIVINTVKELFSEIIDIDSKVLAAMMMGGILQPIVMHNYGRFEKPILEYSDDVIKASLKLIQ